MWRHTWRKNWISCAVLTYNHTALRNVLYSHLSHREMRSSLRESHSFLSLCMCLFISTTVTRTRRHTVLTKKNWENWWETCAVPEKIQNSFRVVLFFTHLNCTVYLRVYGALKLWLCDRRLARIACLTPAGDMDVCPLWVLACIQLTHTHVNLMFSGPCIILLVE